MLKKDITFTDFDGEVKTQTHYFNLTKAECVELQMSVEEFRYLNPQHNRPVIAGAVRGVKAR